MYHKELFFFYLSTQENTQNKKDEDSHSLPLFTEDIGQLCMWFGHSSDSDVFLDRFESTLASIL